jgi:hypothetical protein
MQAIVVIHINIGPYWTADAGPMSHSPLPMDRESIMAPGPIVWRIPFIPLGGASGISFTFHGSNAPALINCSAIISSFLQE